MSATTTGTTGKKARRRRRVHIVVSVILGIGALVIGVFAFLSPGHPFSRIEANNGGIWIFDTQGQRIGRVNVDASQIDAQLKVTDASDVLQAGPNVFLRTAAGLRRVNPASLRLEGEVPLGPGADVQMGGDRISVTDESGRTWILDGDQLAGFDPDRTRPAMQGGDSRSLATVDPEGNVYVLSGSAVHRFPRAEDPTRTKDKKQIPMSGVSAGQKGVSLSVVGDVPVLLDAAGKQLRIGDEDPVDLVKAGVADPAHAVLQWPSAASDHVAIATTDAVYLIPMTGGKARALSTQGSGTPARPVQLDGCVHGAWSGSQTYLTACGDHEPEVGRIPGAPADTDLVLRTDHGLVVLNDRRSGAAWMIDAKMRQVTGWDAPGTSAAGLPGGSPPDAAGHQSALAGHPPALTAGLLMIALAPRRRAPRPLTPSAVPAKERRP